MRLFDANILLPLLRKDHAKHELMKAWFRSLDDPAWAGCALTEAAFIRLSSNESVLPPAERPLVAFEALRKSKLTGFHHRVEFRGGNDRLMLELMRRCQGYRQITDAFLIHIALTNQATLSTTDRRLKHLSPDPDAVEVVPLV